MNIRASNKTTLALLVVFTVFALSGTGVTAADPNGGETLAADPGSALDFIWILVAGFMVMFMQAGFAMLEAGFSRAKNLANIMMKNMVDFSVGGLVFFAIGFALMMGTSAYSLFGTDGFFLEGAAYDVSTILVWFFMMVFCATAATIVSGAVAERPKFISYIIATIVIAAIIFPLYGHWIWGGGWLSSAQQLIDLGGGYAALDFAGSGAVHALGGYIALAAVMLIGPRIGRFDARGKPLPILGHNLGLAGLGAFILWFGWFGFNAGSTLSGHELRIAIIAANTTLAASAAAMTAMAITWLRTGKPDIAMTINGAIAGLVAITAGCAWVAPWASVVIGIIGGIIVCYGFWFLERRGIDDAVGAIPVHGFSGTWGLLALGLLADGTYGVYTTEGPLVTGLLYGNAGFFAVQLFSAVVNIAWAFGIGYALFYVIKKTIGLRVTPEEEMAGLDLVEHGIQAYPDFVHAETGRPLKISRIPAPQKKTNDDGGPYQ